MKRRDGECNEIEGFRERALPFAHRVRAEIEGITLLVRMLLEHRERVRIHQRKQRAGVPVELEKWAFDVAAAGRVELDSRGVGEPRFDAGSVDQEPARRWIEREHA